MKRRKGATLHPPPERLLLPPRLSFETATTRLEKKSGNTGTKALINSDCSLARSGITVYRGYLRFMDTERFEDIPFPRRAHRVSRAVKAVMREGRQTRRGGFFRFFQSGPIGHSFPLSLFPSQNAFWQLCRRTMYRSNHFNDR